MLQLDVRRIVQCPAELDAPPPERVRLPPDAEITGTAAGLGYLAARFAREGLLESRLVDAQADCPPPPATVERAGP